VQTSKQREGWLIPGQADGPPRRTILRFGAAGRPDHKNRTMSDLQLDEAEHRPSGFASASSGTANRIETTGRRKS
jgi:hypothetical protein